MESSGKQKFCMHCGAKLPQGAAFCPSCGGSLKSAESNDGLSEEDTEQEYREGEENGIDESVDEDESEEQQDEEENEEEEVTDEENASDVQEGARSVADEENVDSVDGENGWRPRFFKSCLTICVSVAIGLGWGYVKHLSKSRGRQASREARQKEAKEDVEKDVVIYLDEAATGSTTARQWLIDSLTAALAEDRDGATDDGKTDKAIVEMAAKAMIDDYIKAYKKTLRENGNKKYISLDDLEVPKPPLSVSVRAGMLSDYVVQVRNESDSTKHVRVFIYNGYGYSSIVGSHVKPQTTEDFGYLEFENDWKPKAGDKGFVLVSGYNVLLYFTLLEDAKYETGFRFVLPPDCPLELKKEFLKEIQ